MRLNEQGLSLLKEFEGCKLTAYRDIVGVLTVGYGHTGPDVKAGMTINQDRAEQLLRRDVAKFEAGVETLVDIPISDNEFSALVCLAYNIGLNAFKASTLLKKLNLKDISGAADEFLRWNKAGGKVVAGLTRRRKAERELFLS